MRVYCSVDDSGGIFAFVFVAVNNNNNNIISNFEKTQSLSNSRQTRKNDKMSYHARVVYILRLSGSVVVHAMAYICERKKNKQLSFMTKWPNIVVSGSTKSQPPKWKVGDINNAER